MTEDGVGRLVISVDLELAAHAGSLEHQRKLELVTSHLADLLGRQQLPATFAVADPRHSAASEIILASRTRHEVAILGDASWVGRGAGRERFGRELERRIHSARTAGIQISSLALRDVELAENFDLLVKHQITAIRQNAGGGDSDDQPQLLRFGMWQMPVNFRLPRQPGWFRGNVSAGKRALAKAVNSGSAFLLAIDAGNLAEGDPARLAEVERLLHHAAELRQAQQLEVVSLQQLTSGLERPSAGAPLRSILRAA
jgi:hypothetical protein